MMPGPASHIAFTGGWLARKSPPYTVSSKWRHGESPSPFQFTAALIPPCAHTECERFTGTIEKRSTGTPASAILMVVINPARPPPTTISRSGVMRWCPSSEWEQLHDEPALAEGSDDQEAGGAHHHE